MTEQELREKIHHAIDSKLSGVQEDPFLEQRVLAQEKGEEKIMKRFTLRTIVLIAVLVLSTVCVACAAASSWGLIDYFAWTGSQVPEDFDSGYDQELTQEFGSLRFRVRDAYMNGNTFVSLTEISRLDGAPALFLPSPVLFSPEDRLAILYKGMEEEITIGEYAGEKELPICYANSVFVPENGLDSGSGDMWMEEDRVMVYYSTTNDVRPENGQVTVDWTVGCLDENGEWLETSRKITLPAEEVQSRSLNVGKGVVADGVRVVMDSLTLRETRLELQMDYIYCIDGEMPGDQDKIRNYCFRAVDPVTWSFLPEGSLYRWVEEGKMEGDGSSCFIVSNHTVGLDAVGDTLYLQFLPADAQGGQKDAPTIEVQIK